MGTVIEIDCTTGISTEREQTPDEVAAMEAMTAQIEADAKAKAEADVAKEAAKGTALSKLTALGLTAEEVAAITGQPVVTPAS